jgi:hypothetical protein
MKIPESIIEKYKLTGSTAQVGEAFIHDLSLFESSLPEFKDIMFMECDFMGRPSEYIHIYNKASKRDASVTPEYLIDMPLETVLKFIS